jgi:hypothetical protein
MDWTLRGGRKKYISSDHLELNKVLDRGSVKVAK